MAVESSSGDSSFAGCITVIFVIVALQLLFPSNVFIPLDRRASTMLGAIWVMIIFYLYPSKQDINIGGFVDFDVLIVLTAIMIINFVLLRQPFLSKLEQQMQDLIKRDKNKGFLVVSLVSLFVSPVIMNDGLCLMLVHPVLDAFSPHFPLKRLSSPSNNKDSSKKYFHEHKDEAISIAEDNTDEQDDALFYTLNIACSANIGSALTFSGNPQNLLVAQHLSELISGGVFFALMLLPVFASWVITLGYLQLCRMAQQRGVSTYALFTSLLVTPTNTGKKPRRLATQEEENDEEAETWQEQTEDELGVEMPGTIINLRTSADLLRNAQLPNSHNAPISGAAAVEEEDAERPGAKAVVSVVSGTFTITALLMIIVLEFQGALSLTGLFAGVSLSLLVALYLAKYYPILVSALSVAGQEGQLWTVLFPMPQEDNFDVTMHSISTVSHADLQPRLQPHHPPHPASQSASKVARWQSTIHHRLEASTAVAAASAIEEGVEERKTAAETFKESRGKGPSNKLHRLLHRLQRARRHISESLEALVHELDFNLLLIFTGLFIVSGAFVLTEIPKWLWNDLASSGSSGAFQSWSSIAVLSTYIVTASQLVGNVPVVYMARNQVAQLDTKPQILGWLLLAFVSTVAGNLTLVGSAANIIVAEKSRRHARHPVQLNAPFHFYHCCGVTAVSIIVGIVIIVLEVHLFL